MNKYKKNEGPKDFNIALVAMPWANQTMPSPAIGMLAAVIRKYEPSFGLNCMYPYMSIYKDIGVGLYNKLAMADKLGEFLYACQLYPEKKTSVKAFFADNFSYLNLENRSVAEPLFDKAHKCLENHKNQVVTDLAGKYQVVGFTTSYAQLFASLTVAKQLKERDPQVKIVLGGMGVPYEIGPSVLREYPFVDFIVQGEGEFRFLNLLRSLKHGKPICEEGVLQQGQPTEAKHENNQPLPFFKILKNEITDLNTLPMPDYREFAALAKKHDQRWNITLEGSRGCWWDRVVKTGNPMNSCYFCALNTSSYRQKTVQRLAEEMDTLSSRFGITRIQFLDNIIRRKGIESFTKAIDAHHKEYSYFYEMRGNVQPYEFLLLWESGCNIVQIGIEGLSSAYLKRIGKGTSTIQNLQCMKLCFELGIRSNSNLIIDWPGTTEEEVWETVDTIENYATAYQPCSLSSFALYAGSAMSRMPERFGIKEVTNSHLFKQALPHDVWQRLTLYWLDYETMEKPVSWEPVKKAVDRWHQCHQTFMKQAMSRDELHRKRHLKYRDGRDFLEVFDDRGESLYFRMNRMLRDIYMYCMEIRSFRQISRHFSGRCRESKLAQVLDHFIKYKLMYSEKGRYLSLAMATQPHLAAKRIRKAHDRDLTERDQSQLPIAIEA